MFGSNDNNQQSNDDPVMLDNVAQLAKESSDTIMPSSPPPITPDQSSSQFTPTPAPISAQDDQSGSTTSSSSSDEHRAEPAFGFSSTPVSDPVSAASSFIPTTDSDNDQSATDPQQTSQNDEPAIQATSTPVQEVTAIADPATSQAPDQNHLANLKQQALEHLEPLADHVEGTPEEMFKTTMMMIQANDNHTLLEKALEAAKRIEDDKIRAKAMLDVINEINYFSQDNSDDTTTSQ